MVPLEAQSYGRPVIAFGKGGSLETVIGTYAPLRKQTVYKQAAITGIFFEKQAADSLAKAILAFESAEEIFVPHRIQSHARRFDTSVFLDRMHHYIDAVVAKTSDPASETIPPDERFIEEQQNSPAVSENSVA
jgi:glycosyltransferase involved in cell wall biosynthesis